MGVFADSQILLFETHSLLTYSDFLLVLNLNSINPYKLTNFMKKSFVFNADAFFMQR